MKAGKKPELLIPAGSLEVLKTAVIYGADAVYIGGEVFSLRAKAKNFTMEEIREGIAFAQDALAPSVASAAIHIFDFNRELLGAIIIVGFQDAISSSPNDELARYLLTISKDISSQFGFSE